MQVTETHVDLAPTVAKLFDDVDELRGVMELCEEFLDRYGQTPPGLFESPMYRRRAADLLESVRSVLEQTK